ncbi:MAG: hypothetical protein WAU02_02715 [Candidatus Saccharimonadales bacterium]
MDHLPPHTPPHELLDMKLRELTELSETDADALSERLLLEIESTDWAEEDKSLVQHALADAARIHAGDKQGTRPVIVHPLRNAIRILSRDHFAVRDRPDLVIAALLHDTVEDRPLRWLSDEASDVYDQDLSGLTHDQLCDIQNAAYAAISQRYSPRIASLVKYLTRSPYPDAILQGNPHILVDKTLRKAKWEFYSNDIRSLFHEFDAGGAKIVKLSDYIDNFAGAIRYHEKPERRVNYARKYIDLAPTVKNFVVSSRILTDEKVKERILRQIDAAVALANRLLEEDVPIDALQAPNHIAM